MKFIKIWIKKYTVNYTVWFAEKALELLSFFVTEITQSYILFFLCRNILLEKKHI